jgi:hypothetical protein
MDEACTAIRDGLSEWCLELLGRTNGRLEMQEVEGHTEQVRAIDGAVGGSRNDNTKRTLDKINEGTSDDDTCRVGTTSSLNVETNDETTCDDW